MIAGLAGSGQLKPAMSSVLRLAAGLLALVPALHGAGAVRQVTIGPAPVERAAQVVTLTLPQAFAAGAILRDERGEVVPLQAEADLTARFILARQAAGQTLKFTLEAGRLPEQGNVQVVEEPSPPRPGNTPGIVSATTPSRIRPNTGRLRVSVGGRPILYYQMDRDALPREGIDPALRRAAYLHPVLTPRGVPVTEDYPADNLTRHGIASLGPTMARGQRSFDFSMTSNVPATVEFGGIDNTWTGPVHGGFASWQRWIDDQSAKAPVLVNEAWELTAYAVPKSLGEINVFDLVITQTNATSGPLDFQSGLGVQGSAVSVAPGRTAKFRDLREAGNAARWIGFSGLIKDDSAGLAVLLPSTATIVSSSMDPAPTYLEALAPVTAPGMSGLASGARATQRYRVIVFDGPPNEALLEALWNGYTLPAVVTIAPADGR